MDNDDRDIYIKFVNIIHNYDDTASVDHDNINYKFASIDDLDSLDYNIIGSNNISKPKPKHDRDTPFFIIYAVYDHDECPICRDDDKYDDYDYDDSGFPPSFTDDDPNDPF